MVFVKSFTQIVFEGVPGCGKSTLTTQMAKTMQEKLGDDYLVLLNHKLVNEGAVEVAINSESNRGNSFLRNIYTPNHKEAYLMDACTISACLLATELQTYAKFQVCETRGEKHVVNVLERVSFNAAAMFVPAAFYNMRENVDVVGHHADNDWEHVKMAQERLTMAALASIPEKVKNLIVYVRASPDKAFSRVLARGREYESTGLTWEYMTHLCGIHDDFFSPCYVGRRVPALRDILPSSNCLCFSTDEAFQEEAEKREESNKRLVRKVTETIMSLVLDN